MTTNSTTYLNRTQSSATSDKIGTFSAWIKGMMQDETNSIFSGHTDSSNRIALYWGTRLQIYGAISGSQSVYLQTTQVLRDVNAWYHIVVAWDTTQGTASNRFKIYINGEQVTAFDTETYPTQNADVYWNKGTTSIVGARYISSVVNYFYGYMSHVSFVDGQALAPTVFGQTDSTSGIWKFKSPSGVTWGNNGFHLKFESSGNLGLDSSGNSNTFTVNSNGRQALDTPSNVHATWNPLAKLYNGTYTFTNGNTTCEVNVRRGTHSTLGASSGKFYWETKLISNNNTNNNATGISAKHSTAGNDGTGEAAEEYIYKSDGQKTSNNTSSSYGNSYTNGDIIGVAMDLDNNKLYFSKNGTWQNSGVPTSGSTGTGAISITAADSTTDGFYVANAGNENDTAKWSANFGNGYFGTTAISSAGSNGNGSLFEYDVPSGYYALNTKNINTYG